MFLPFFLYHIHKAAQANKMMTVRGLPNLVIKELVAVQIRIRSSDNACKPLIETRKPRQMELYDPAQNEKQDKKRSYQPPEMMFYISYNSSFEAMTYYSIFGPAKKR